MKLKKRGVHHIKHTRHDTARHGIWRCFQSIFRRCGLLPLGQYTERHCIGGHRGMPAFGGIRSYSRHSFTARVSLPAFGVFLFSSSCRTLIFAVGVEDRSGVGHRPSYLDSRADNACAHMSHRGCCGDVVVWLCRRLSLSLSCHSLAVKLGLLRPLLLALLDQGMRHEDNCVSAYLPPTLRTPVLWKRYGGS